MLNTKIELALKIGDRVQPRSEWKDDPNSVPTGRIVQIEPWGGEGAIHVEGEKRAFAGFVFELESSGVALDIEDDED